MGKKKLLPLGLLAAAVLLLAALLAVLALTAGDAEEDAGIPLFSASPTDVTRLSYQDGTSDVVLVRNDDGSWILESDPLLPIDGSAVSEILDGLTGMTALRALDPDTAEVGAMGFNSPAMTFAFTADDESYTLTAGAQNAMADAYYVRLQDGSLYTVSLSAFTALCKTPQQLYLAQDITDIESTEVASLTLDTGGGTLAFTRDSEGHWTLDGDADFPLDQDIVSRMSNTICALTTEWSITAPEADSVYGLDRPNAVVTLTATDGRSVQCVFGSTDPEDEAVSYLRASCDESVVYEIPANHLTVFAYTRDTLRAATAESATGESANG